MTSLLEQASPGPADAGLRTTPPRILPAWRKPFWSSVLLGLLGFLVSFAGSWIPSPWLDEAATAHIINYSVSDMAALWQHIDGVFSPYYLFMHFWVKVTGITPFWLRVPSLLSVGVGTAAMAATGRSTAGWKAQVLYGLCFALLPRTTAMGIEARPYAISAMFTALALLAVVKLHQRRSRWYWPLLGLSIVGAVSAHLFAVLPLIGLILVALIIFPKWGRLGLLATSALAGLACLPLATLGLREQQQVAWIAKAPFSIADQALVEAWFTSRVDPNPNGSFLPLHYVALALSIIAALTVVVALVSGRRRLPTVRLALGLVPPLVAVGLLWGDSVLTAPVLMGRYFTSSAPFIAMLLAECIMLLRPYIKLFVAALLAIGCLVLIVSQREPYAKIPWNDYSFIASTIHGQATTGDGLLMEPDAVPTNTARSAIDLYPRDFAPLVDIAQPQKAALNYPISVDPPIVDLSTRPSLPHRVWLVTALGQKSNYASQLTGLGFKPTSESSGPGHAVALWVRP